MSDHDLLIETGRFTKIPRDKRLCKTCNEIDDEQHFFLHCQINSNLRGQFLLYFKENYADFISCCSSKKLSL